MQSIIKEIVLSNLIINVDSYMYYQVDCDDDFRYNITNEYLNIVYSKINTLTNMHAKANLHLMLRIKKSKKKINHNDIHSLMQSVYLCQNFNG